MRYRRRGMSWLSRRRGASGGGPRAGASDLHVADPRFDDWEVVRDFEDVETASAWCRHLREAGMEAVITSDWPLDRFGRGDIALRVQSGHWSDAEEFLSSLDEE
jgi:hypothetical protein